MYRVHNISIQSENHGKAYAILMKHTSEIDDFRISSQKNSDGKYTVTYWIKPYIYEDLERITDEFKQNGIQVLDH